MSRIYLHGHASGSVQGVSYRAFARTHALAHRVEGYARNLRDGRVELLLCGDQRDVEAVVAQLRRGPPLARVDALDLLPAPARDCDGFRIE